MIKRTLIAIAVVALLATSAHAALTEYYFPFGDHHAVKVDGSETVRWPFEYKELTVCSIPIKLRVGMYVQVKDCKKKKVILQQRDCKDQVIGKGDGDYPCYYGCVKFDVRANFDAKIGQSLEKLKIGDEYVIKDWSCSVVSGGDVPGDGKWHEVEICVKTWKTQIWYGNPNDEATVGKLHVRVKPQA